MKTYRRRRTCLVYFVDFIVTTGNFLMTVNHSRFPGGEGAAAELIFKTGALSTKWDGVGGRGGPLYVGGVSMHLHAATMPFSFFIIYLSIYLFCIQHVVLPGCKVAGGIWEGDKSSVHLLSSRASLSLSSRPDCRRKFRSAHTLQLANTNF